MSSFVHLLDQRRLIGPGGSTVAGEIYFYYTGTTVKAPIYQDSGLTVPSDNPVSVAAGEIIPTLYLDDAITYRRVIEYSDGTTDQTDPLGNIFSEDQVGVPVGTVMDYSGAVAPEGFLFCYGQALSRTDYSELFDAIGTTYGSGDGSTTFNVPDFRGRVAAGKDNMGGTAAGRLSSIVSGTTLGATGGQEEHTLTVAQMPSHKHSVTDPGHTHPYTRAVTPSGTYFDSGSGSTTTTAATGSSTTGIDVNYNGGGEAHTNLQPTIVVNKIIKVAPITFLSLLGLGADFSGKLNASAAGVSVTATDMGSFTGSTITDGSTIKGALQELETAVDVNDAAIVSLTNDVSSIEASLDAYLPSFATVAAAKVDVSATVDTILIVGRANSIWKRWDVSMEALPAAEKDYTWFEANDASKWILAEHVVTPAMCGAVGDAKTFNQTTMKMEQNDSATNDTLAVHYALAFHRRGRKLLIDKWYGIYPQTSGATLDTNGPTSSDRSRPIESGFLVPRRTYKVFSTAGTGTITYDGTVYADTETFVAETWDARFSASGDALVYDVITAGAYLDMRTDEAPSVTNYQRYIDIDCLKNAGLMLCEAGCALAIFGFFPNDAAATVQSKIFNSRVVLNTEALESLSTVGDPIDTIGTFLSDLSHGSEISLNSHYTNVGGIMKSCWNVRYDQLNWFGKKIGFCGFVIHNANSSNVLKTFFHGGCIAGFLKFKSAHGANVGDTILVSFNGVSQFSGTVSAVNNTTQLTCDNWTKASSTLLGSWTATVNGGAAIDIINSKATWSKGMLVCNAEGFKVFLDAQNHGGFGIDYLIDKDQGNASFYADGHIEGPSTGIRVQRNNTLSGDEDLAYFSWKGSAFGGREDSGSEFGNYHAMDLDYVSGGSVEGWTWAREYIASAGHASVWAASTAYSLNDVVVLRHGVYICSTAGTSGARGPVGTGTAISDGTAAWDYVRPVNNTVRFSENCRNIIDLTNVQEINTIYNQSCNLQPPKVRAIATAKSFGSSAGTLVIDRSGITAGDGSATNYRLSDYISSLTEERRQPLEIEAEWQVTVNTAPASGAYTGTRYIGMQFTYSGQNSENMHFERVSATEANEQGVIRRTIRIPLSQYMDFTAQAVVGGTGGSWDVDMQLRLRRMFY